MLGLGLVLDDQVVAGFDQAAEFVVTVMPFATLRVDALEQLAAEYVFLPAVAHGVYVFVDLIEGAPVVMILATEAVGDVGLAFFQVVFEAVVLAIAAPMANDSPFIVGFGGVVLMPCRFKLCQGGLTLCLDSLPIARKTMREP